MQVKKLYKYAEGNGYIVTPNAKSLNDDVYVYRLVADENKILENSKTLEEVFVIDIQKGDEINWIEKDYIPEQKEEDEINIEEGQMNNDNFTNF